MPVASLGYYLVQTFRQSELPLFGPMEKNMRAYDRIKLERGREVTLETPEFLEQARKLLAKGLPVQLRMSGGSMRPAIEDGDIITLEPISADFPRQGDIVLYHSAQDTAVIHRIVRLERSGPERAIVTRGDGAMQNDLPVSVNRVLGRVKLVERAGERVAIDKPAISFGRRIKNWLRWWKR